MSRERELRSPLRYAASLAVAWSTGAVPHHCYANVRNALDEMPFLHDAFLVEGFLLWEQETRCVVIEHAWCQQQQGSVIDPSIVLLASIRQARCWYRPGIIHEPSAWRALAAADLPTVHLRDREEEGASLPVSYQEAYQTALSLAHRFAEARVPPKEVVIEPSLALASLHPPFRLHTHVVSSSDWLTGTHHHTREP
ncbi:hypothetical protein KSF_087080 [Reticulibacter mediterranei]|uniref:Uncharacterized protein n=1 Tax=Reticulibacter mediterranei TaxID=2778369 RepID=A0A8J3IUB2_9CHLR|nr:hypothetical protein [Reticulibacter mediterranei]GHO98660.1 hypothetical protein KSF_087080 [Reticulibacter mediterranei]